MTNEDEDHKAQQAAERLASAQTARVLLEVQAGLIPGQPEPELTRRFGITSAEWEAATDQGLLLLEKYSVAHAYALTLLDPSRVNWTRVDWIWL